MREAVANENGEKMGEGNKGSQSETCNYRAKRGINPVMHSDHSVSASLTMTSPIPPY